MSKKIWSLSMMLCHDTLTEQWALSQPSVSSPFSIAYYMQGTISREDGQQQISIPSCSRYTAFLFTGIDMTWNTFGDQQCAFLPWLARKMNYPSTEHKLRQNWACDPFPGKWKTPQVWSIKAWLVTWDPKRWSWSKILTDLSKLRSGSN